MGKPILNLSILVANYNNAIYLPDFIQSIMNSSCEPLELLIVDDGSTDNSRDILKAYAHLPYACFHYFKHNRGFAHALNLGLESARGIYIMRADPDDLLHPEKMERQFQYLDNHTEISGVGCNVSYFRQNPGKVINSSNFPLTAKGTSNAWKKGEHGMQHPTAMVRAEVFKQYRYIQDHVPAEDYDLFARMTKDGHCFTNLTESLYYMRIHAYSASSRIKPETIRKTYTLRDNIFHQKTSRMKILCYYLYMRSYRNYLLNYPRPWSYFHLLASALFYPAKVIKRLRGKP